MRWISDRIGNQAKALSAAWLLRQTGASRRPGWLGMLLELGLVIVWGVWFTRSYLPLDSQRIPLGREFLSAIQTHHLWTRYAICGWCALWNGSARGGVPAFVDPHGSMLHPIVALTTVIWGVIQGAKVALVISFALAGVAVWWLAKELGLGRVPRVWSGLMAVVGGHLAFKMELGAFGVILATVMSSFFFPAALRLHREGTWRSVVLLGVVLASAVLAGQGYMQVGLLAAIPALLILLLGPNLKLRGAWKGFLAAAAIAFLLAAPFLVPLLHFLPNFAKEFDPEFTAAQPLRYLPLNLVINDDAFYVSDSLQKLPFPHLNALFIGWIPVILAVIGLTMAGHELRRVPDQHLLGVVDPDEVVEVHEMGVRDRRDPPAPAVLLPAEGPVLFEGGPVGRRGRPQSVEEALCAVQKPLQPRDHLGPPSIVHHSLLLCRDFIGALQPQTPV